MHHLLFVIAIIVTLAAGAVEAGLGWLCYRVE